MKKFYSIEDLAEAIGYTKQGISWQIARGNIKPIATHPICIFDQKEFDRVLQTARTGKHKSFSRSGRHGKPKQ
jgi:hypothetical protein